MLLPLSKAHRKRGYKLAFRLITLTIGVACVLWGMSNNISVYITPSQVMIDKQLCANTQCRLGAIVKKGSLIWQKSRLSFIALDNKNNAIELPVHYTGGLPNLFKEGAMMLAEGTIKQGVFQATRILAKHDENYQPPV